MKKLLYMIVCLGWANLCFAQNMFWSFDDSQNPLPIPSECDAKFDEIRGGVFMPTMDEMYEYGVAFLKNPALSVQQQGAYCLLAAALQGHADAQLEMAKLYENGRVVAQDDLSAYKWAFISALNGNKSAEKLTLMLEQILTTEDLSQTTAAIQATRMQIQENLQKQIQEEREQIEQERTKLNEMNTAIQNNNVQPNVPGEPVPELEKEQRDPEIRILTDEGLSPELLQRPNNSLINIFNESDRMK